MAKAKKLPSGNYRARVTVTDKNGVKHTESFTRPTAAEASLAAEQYRSTAHRHRRNDLTVCEAIEKYIEVKHNVLSPSTVYGYTRYKQAYAPIAKIRLSNLTEEIVQDFVNKFSKGHSPKYVKNVYGLLSSTIRLFQPDLRIESTLPKNFAQRLNVPTEDDATRLISETSGYMKIAICLAGFCSLRRGEICGLKYKDVDMERNKIYVHADIVTNENYKWIYKEIPKTDDSHRLIDCPQFLIDMIGEGDPEEHIIKVVPLTITKNFLKLTRKLDIDVHFHDLRSFFASSLMMKVPNVFIAQQGGWSKGSKVMERHYQRIMEDKKSEYAQQTEAYFKTVFNGKSGVKHTNEQASAS